MTLQHWRAFRRLVLWRHLIKVRDRVSFDLESELFILAFSLVLFFVNSTTIALVWIHAKPFSKNWRSFLPELWSYITSNQWPSADQLNIPLWYKASGIIAKKKLNIVCRLGGFHTLLSFIGSIGYVMGESGSEEVLTEVSAGNSVLHMLSGKAYTRAVRGYILVNSDCSEALVELEKQLDIKKEQLKNSSQTARLWINMLMWWSCLFGKNR